MFRNEHWRFVLGVTCLVSFPVGSGIRAAFAQGLPLPSGRDQPDLSHWPNGSIRDGGPVCPQDAARCSDGTVVFRRGPDCEMAPCPGTFGPGSARGKKTE